MAARIRCLSFLSPRGARSTMSKPVPNNLERLIWPTYSWRAKSVNTQLFYIRDRRQADLAINNLCKGPLGFDLEWRPNYIKGQPENPVALVQLSSKNTILLIQICAMTSNISPHFILNPLRLNICSEFPTKLRELLYDPNVVKAGVGIQRKSDHHALLQNKLIFLLTR